MKTIFNDPLSWAKSLVGNKWTFIVLVGAHLLICVDIGLIVYPMGMGSLFLPFFIFGMFLPVLYLYGLRRLVVLVESKDESGT